MNISNFKKILLLLIVVNLSLVIVASVSDRLLEQVFFIDTIEASGFRALTEESQTAFLGTSRVTAGINPSLMERNATNIAGPFFNYRTLFLIVSKHKRLFAKLKTVFIEFDADMLVLDSRIASPVYHRSLLSFAIRDISPLNSLIKNPGKLALAGFPYLYGRKLTPFHLAKNAKGSALNSLRGHQKSRYVYPATSQESTIAKINYKLELARSENIGKQEYSLVEMLKFFKETEIHVRLIRMPKHRHYLAAYLREWEKLCTETIDRLKKDYSFEYLDLSATFPELTQLYRDSDHLNSAGASKLVSLLEKSDAE